MEYLSPLDQTEDFKLITYIFQCINLPPGDYNGLSDPYCRIFYDQNEKRTQVVKKSLHPQFYE